MDLNSYDWIFINTSGGKDSQTMLRQVMLMVAVQEFPLDRVIAVHADLGHIEWPGVKELAQEQAEHYGIPMLSIARPQGNLLQQVKDRGRWPSPDNRYCTSDHKRDQIRKLVTQTTNAIEWPAERPMRVLNCLGMRAEESANRAKLLELMPNKRYSCKTRVVDNWHPIHRWTEVEVWNDITISGVRYHWAYDAGIPRLSCRFCIYMPEAVLYRSFQLNPELYQDYVDTEKLVGHAFQFSKGEPLWLSRFQDPTYQAPVGKLTAWNM